MQSSENLSGPFQDFHLEWRSSKTPSISPEFGKDFLHETVFLMEAFEKTGLMVEPHVYSVEEYSRAEEGSFLFNEVIEKGIPLIHLDSTL